MGRVPQKCMLVVAIPKQGFKRRIPFFGITPTIDLSSAAFTDYVV